jgi:hypothetical protein
MAKSTPKPPFSIISPQPIEPARPLGAAGRQLWQQVQGEYRITDSGGCELLLQACGALDTAEALAVEIAADGAVIRGKTGPRSHPAIRDQLAARSLCVRTLQRLGVNVSVVPVRGPGRPPKLFGRY